MKVRTWIDVSQEVDVVIDLEDISAAVAESLARVHITDDLDGSPVSLVGFTDFINVIAKCLKGVTDEQIALLNEAQRALIRTHLEEQAERYAEVAR